MAALVDLVAALLVGSFSNCLRERAVDVRHLRVALLLVLVLDVGTLSCVLLVLSQHWNESIRVVVANLLRHVGLVQLLLFIWEIKVKSILFLVLFLLPHKLIVLSDSLRNERVPFELDVFVKAKLIFPIFSDPGKPVNLTLLVLEDGW